MLKQVIGFFLVMTVTKHCGSTSLKFLNHKGCNHGSTYVKDDIKSTQFWESSYATKLWLAIVSVLFKLGREGYVGENRHLSPHSSSFTSLYYLYSAGWVRSLVASNTETVVSVHASLIMLATDTSLK